MVAPPWLESLLSTTFFQICEVHREVARNECNMFCLNCHTNAFCYCCISSRHNNHQVIQIRRSSYHDVVRASEIQRVLNISGVQTYVINSARVLFLNERPQPRLLAKSVGHNMCDICGRSLLDPFRFCSLGCKLVGVKRNGNASFSIEEKGEEGGLSSISTMRSDNSNRKDKEREEELHESSQQAISSTMLDSPSNSRRRKGIPHRAPFKS